MPGRTTPRTVLVIDDSPEDRAVVRRLIMSRRPDSVLVEAETGRDGLVACRAVPDCVLLDFYLPDMTGREWLDAWAADSGGARPVPVVMLTGHDDDAAAADALQRGAHDYLTKDALSAPALGRAIENAIEKARIGRELEEQRAAAVLRSHALERLRDELQAKVTELASATRAKDRFLAVMSHEMRTPLNAILGYADLLDLGVGGEGLSAGQHQHVDRIRVGGRHLLDLINDLLDLTRMDANRLELDVRAVDARGVVEEVTALLQAPAAAKGLTLEADLGPGDLPPVVADLQRLRQVLINVVGNAVKFTERGGVAVRCLPPGPDGAVRLTITDTGIGIARDALPLVFAEFYQADGELTRRRDGAGLGLAISRRLVELMRGRITAESTPGAGSVFTLALPAATPGSALRPDDVAQHGARMAAHVEGDAGGTAAVSVVAYAAEAAPLRHLEERVRSGVRLVWTTDAGDVVALTRREQASLVILDAGSPDGNAWAVAQALHGSPDLATTAVLLLPSLPIQTGDDPGEGVDLGWIALVPKPFTAQQLTRAVSSAARDTAATRAAVPAAESRGAHLHEVLIVDDDLDSRRVAARFLEEAGFRVREAADGETALVEMRHRPPDVVVLDLMMPVLDGFGVLATIRADSRLTRLPVVVLTAKSLTEAERRFLSRSAVRVLQKGEHRLADVAALVLRASGVPRLTHQTRSPGDGRSARGDA